MTWLRRLRPAFYLIGGVLLVGSLFGARALTAGNGDDGPKSVNTPAAAKGNGPIVMGTADSDPGPVSYGLPPVMQSGTVAKVFVKDGQEIKADEPLYQFDVALQKSDLDLATVKVSQAKHEVAKAHEVKTQHAKKVAIAEQALETAKKRVSTLNVLYTVTRNNIEEGLKAAAGGMIAPDQLKAKLENNPDLLRANVNWIDAGSAEKQLERELELLKSTNVDLLVKEAEIAVELAEKAQAKAQTVVDLCVVRAKTAGTVEQVKISPGATMGISTRDPALWLVPAGPRIVRAEIEAEFAHRVSADIVGKEVTIMDHSDPKLTYKGKVRQVGGTFLPKRTEGLLQNDTRVLEAIIEVSDPAPAGKPPLRVGQRVRVNLGQ